MPPAISDDAVYEQLIAKIFSGRIPPGARLIERELAEELGVSRVPVREALTRMVAQGALIGGEKRQSVRVRRYTAEEIRQLFLYREMVEGGAARAAASRADEATLARLDQICDAMEADVNRREFNERWANLEHEFHHTIAGASGNEWVAAALHLLLQQSHYVFYRLRWQTLAELSDEGIRRIRERTVRTHRDVVAQIRAGDPDGAEAAMRSHIRESYEGDHWPDRAAPSDPATE